MANYYYIRNDGIRGAGDLAFSTPQTGSFTTLTTAGYYPSLVAAQAATNPVPSSGDFFLASDIHSYSIGSSQTLTIDGAIYSAVSDINIDQSRRSGNFAAETVTGTSADYFFSMDSILSGFSVTSSDNIQVTGGHNLTLIDSKWSVTGSADAIQCAGDGSSISMINTEISLGNVASVMYVGGGAVFEMLNVTTTGAAANRLFSGGFQNGGGNVYASGCDFSSVTGTLIAVVGGFLDGDDTINVRFDNCKIAAGVLFTDETFLSYGQRALFTRCSDDAAAMEYKYHLHAFGGDIFDVISEYRTEDAAFTLSNQKISYQVTTNTGANLTKPLWFDFPMTSFVELSSTSTLTFYLTSSDATLTNKDIYAEVSYPDGTTYTTNLFATSAPVTVGGSIDLIIAGTGLTADGGASTWLVGQGNNYKIDVVCTSGADCQPTIKFYVTKPSTVIYLASEYGLS